MKTIVDSGAYSAWTKAGEIDLREYVRFIKRYGRFFDVVVNLDVIPGSGGQREECPEAIEHAAKASYENLQRMKDAGLHPIPVYHQDEGAHWLERYLEDGEHFIGLSAWKRQHRGDIIAFFDRCFDLITQADRPLVKTHGFGATSPLICHRYPWRSVDSIRWARAAGFGQVPLPVYTEGRPDYTVQPMIVSLTERSGHDSRHINVLDKFDLARLRRYLTEEVGMDIATAQLAGYRPRVWATFFKGLEAICENQQCSALLRHRSQRLRPADWSFEIALVSDTTKGLNDALAQCQVRRRLLSYYKLRNMDDAKLEAFFSRE